MPVLWLLSLAAAAFWFAMAAARRLPELPSAPASYGAYAAAAAFSGGGALFALFALLPGAAFLPYAAVVLPAAAAAAHSRRMAIGRRRARAGFEHLALAVLAAAAAAAVLTTAGIVFAVAAESARFFQLIPIDEFLFGTVWSPQIAIREDQAGAAGAFGILPVLSGTLLITAVAMAVATPSGLAVAVYLAEFAGKKTRARVKPALEILAGVPTIVYGFFAVAVLSPLLRDLAAELGGQMEGESALAAGLVMGMMLIPFVASLSEDALRAVPEELRQGAYGLGSTRFETAFLVAAPAAMPGIAAGILLALSRAIGETMIVVMAAGIAANMTLNPLESVTTVTVQIVTLLVGDQEFDDPKTLAAFALGLALFCMTLVLNLLALRIVRKYRQTYD